jgi:hypothetical protein
VFWFSSAAVWGLHAVDISALAKFALLEAVFAFRTLEFSNGLVRLEVNGGTRFLHLRFLVPVMRLQRVLPSPALPFMCSGDDPVRDEPGFVFWQRRASLWETRELRPVDCDPSNGCSPRNPRIIPEGDSWGARAEQQLFFGSARLTS